MKRPRPTDRDMIIGFLSFGAGGLTFYGLMRLFEMPH